MKVAVIFFIGLIQPLQAVLAQSAAERAAVMEPIHRLFEGMKLGDSSQVRSAFATEVTMATLGVDKTGKPFLRRETSIADFLKSIGTSHPQVYRELIWDEKIEIDGNFAQVWVDYAFYLGTKFNHCGVDAFQLLRGADGHWTIFHLADTRRAADCQIPEKISQQVK